MDVQVKVEDEGAGPDPNGESGQGLEFDDTSEFVRAIQYNPVIVKEEQKPVNSAHIRTQLKQPTPARTRTGSPMEVDQMLHELEAGEVEVKEEEEDDEEMLNAIEAALNTAEAEMVNGGDGADADVGELLLIEALLTLGLYRSELLPKQPSRLAWRRRSPSSANRASLLMQVRTTKSVSECNCSVTYGSRNSGGE